MGTLQTPQAKATGGAVEIKVKSKSRGRGRPRHMGKAEKANLISQTGLLFLCRQRPTLPHTFACSTIGPAGLNLRRFAGVSEAGARSRNPERFVRGISNFRVLDGNGRLILRLSCAIIGAQGACMALDLRSYLLKYHESCKGAYDFPKIEKGLNPLREGRERLKPEHIKRIFHPDNTPFTIFWPNPKKEDLDKIAKKPLLVDLKSQDQEALARKMLGVFHNTGVVSIILRFIHPDVFGVFSTPVLNALQVNNNSTVKLYLAYCEELVAWKDHFHMTSVADTEMAILNLAQTIKGKDSEEARRATGEFAKDVWVQRRRVTNAVAAFLRTFKESTLGNLELAKILVEQDARIAGMIAGFEYERLLGEASWRFRGRKLGRGEAADLLNDLAFHGELSGDDRCKLDKVWDTRNDAVHELAPPKVDVVEEMIDQTKRICSGWDRTVASKRGQTLLKSQAADG